MKNKQEYNWDLSICNREDLMCQNIFIDKEYINDKCKCIHSDTCKAIVDLLENKKLEEALELTKNING